MIGWVIAMYLMVAAFAVGGCVACAWLTARTHHPHWLCGYCAGRRRHRGRVAEPDSAYIIDRCHTDFYTLPPDRED